MRRVRPFRDPFRSLTAAGISLAALFTLAGPAAGPAAADEEGQTGRYSSTVAFTLPGPRVFPEGIAVDARTGDFYVGSYETGAVYRAAPGQKAADVFLPDGADGRTTAAGLKVDRLGRLWVTDPDGVMVYEIATRKRLARFVSATPDTALLNDLDITPDGTAYITDSYLDVVHRVTPAQLQQAVAAGGDGGVLTVAHDLGGSLAPHPAGSVALNGIESDATGSYLLTVDSAAGELFRIDLATGAIRKVSVPGADLEFGDGLHLESGKLWIAHYGTNKISRLRISTSGTTGVLEAQVVDTTLEMPTTLVRRSGHLYVVRSQFDKKDSGTPELPFKIADVTGI